MHAAKERILAGARETLNDPELRSVLIELEAADTVRNTRLQAVFEAAGFSLSLRGRQVQGQVVNGVFARRPAPVAPPVRAVL